MIYTQIHITNFYSSSKLAKICYFFFPFSVVLYFKNWCMRQSIDDWKFIRNCKYFMTGILRYLILKVISQRKSKQKFAKLGGNISFEQILIKTQTKVLHLAGALLEHFLEETLFSMSLRLQRLDQPSNMAIFLSDVIHT